MGDCMRFEEIVGRLRGIGDLADEDMDFYITHEATCRRPEHRAPTWKELRNYPGLHDLPPRLLGQLARALGPADK